MNLATIDRDYYETNTSIGYITGKKAKKVKYKRINKQRNAVARQDPIAKEEIDHGSFDKVKENIGPVSTS